MVCTTAQINHSWIRIHAFWFLNNFSFVLLGTQSYLRWVNFLNKQHKYDKSNNQTINKDEYCHIHIFICWCTFVTSCFMYVSEDLKYNGWMNKYYQTSQLVPSTLSLDRRKAEAMSDSLQSQRVHQIFKSFLNFPN